MAKRIKRVLHEHLKTQQTDVAWELALNELKNSGALTYDNPIQRNGRGDVPPDLKKRHVAYNTRLNYVFNTMQEHDLDTEFKESLKNVFVSLAERNQIPQPENAAIKAYKNIFSPKNTNNYYTKEVSHDHKVIRNSTNANALNNDPPYDPSGFFKQLNAGVKELPYFKEYAEDMRDSKKVVVITRKPAELEDNVNDVLSAVIELTLYNLCRRFLTPAEKNEPPLFEFYFLQKENINEKFWIKLRDLIKDQLKKEVDLLAAFDIYFNKSISKIPVSDLQKKVNNFLTFSCSKGFIKVFESNNPFVFMTPHTAFDPDDKAEAKVYYHYSVNGQESASMKAFARDFWLNSIWSDFRNKSTEVGAALIFGELNSVS